MPTWDEFTAVFGPTEILLSLIILACVILGREQGRIFRRKRNAKKTSKEG